MKTYEEMAQSALLRIDRYKTEQKKRRKAVKRIAVPAACFCIVAVIEFSAWQSGIFQKTPEGAFCSGPDAETSGVPIPYPDGTIRREALPEVFPEHPILRPGDEGYISPIPTPAPNAPDGNIADRPTHTADAPGESDAQIITGIGGGQKGGDVTDGYAYLLWKNSLSVSGALYYAMEENPGGTFSVLAAYRPATANITDFTYEGQTLSALAIAADNERLLPDKMRELLKQGDELKYGTALYETGTPDGIKWDKTLYENTVAYFGELLDKYIVDGQFLRDALEADIAALSSVRITTPDGSTTVSYIGNTSAREQYALAYNAYLETVLPEAVSRLTAHGIQCERAAYRYDALSLLVTAEQLEALPLDDLECWYFTLNSGDLKGTENPVTDETGLQVVN